MPLFKLFGDSSPSTLENYATSLAEKGELDDALKIQQLALDLITENRTTEHYTDEQEQGLRARWELYRRKRPYRTDNLNQIPIQQPEENNSNSKLTFK